MLLARVVTALILVPIVIGVLFFAPPSALAIFFGLIGCAAFYEFAMMAECSRVTSAIAIVLLVGLMWLTWTNAELQPLIAVLALSTWVLTFVVITTTGRWTSSKIGILASGAFFLLATWSSLVVLRDTGPVVILWLFVSIWSVDIGAYFAGKRFGRRQFAPGISPNKTWEGVFGGVVLALVVGGAGALFVPGALGLALIGILPFAIYGDLFESAVKRSVDVKDSGSLLPGHGGVLDRIDSLLPTAPLLVVADFLFALSSW